MFLELSLVDVDLLVDLVEGVGQGLNLGLVFFHLNHDFLHLTLLLAQDLDGFGVSSLFFVQFQFQVA